MNPIFLIVGPPAVGKSTTSRALAVRFAKSIHIGVDNLRDMVVSGLVLPSAAWSDELTQQINLARGAAVHMALKYREAGFAVVIDDFWDPNHLTDYQALLGQTNLRKVVLYPEQAEAHRRNLQRSGDSPARGYIDEGIRIVYQQLNPVLSQLSETGWHIVDTTALDVEKTVVLLEK
jgi:chloramphenicol 3-O-phosphotransferase